MSSILLNPALGKFPTSSPQSDRAMTISGVRSKTFLFLAISLISAFSFWMILRREIIDSVIQFPWNMVLVLAFLIAPGCYVLISYKPALAKLLGPLYACAVGILFGTWSGLAERNYPGIALVTNIGTYGICFGLLALYRHRVISVSNKLVGFISAFVSGLIFVWSLDSLASILFLDYHALFLSNPGDIVGLALIAVLGAVVLYLDFDFVNKQIDCDTPKEWEWYAAFGLFTEVAWIYLALLFLIIRVLRPQNEKS